MTWIWVYLAAWAVTTAITFLVSRRFGDHTRPDRDIFAVSLFAGAVWPFVLHRNHRAEFGRDLFDG